ncbi:MAG: YggT family protein [Anaerolineae bacterium]|nr:YggT family protein [Anaerolineae bacterium]
MRAIIEVLNFLLSLYSFILLCRVLLSWIQVDPFTNPVARFLYNLTEPLLEPIRSILPPVGMMDFSPLVAFVLIIAFQQALSILTAGL